MSSSVQDVILEEIERMKKKLKKMSHRRRRHRHVSHRRSRYSTSRTRSRSRIRSRSTSPSQSPHRDNHSVSPPFPPTVPPEQLGKENVDPITINVENVDGVVIPEALLTALGNDKPLEEKYGPNINNLIGSRWENIILNDSEEIKDILKLYKVPKNCPLLEAPELNPEVKAAITESALIQDQVLKTKQQQLGIALACLGQAMTNILAGNEVSEALKYLSDGTKILTSLHHGDTNTRKQLLAPLLDKSFTKIAESILRSKYLFGENLSEIIKNNKEIEKSVVQLRKPKPTFNRSGNWGGGSTPNTTEGTNKAVQSQTKKSYQPTKKPLKHAPVNRPERDYQRARYRH